MNEDIFDDSDLEISPEGQAMIDEENRRKFGWNEKGQSHETQALIDRVMATKNEGNHETIQDIMRELGYDGDEQRRHESPVVRAV